MTTATAAPDTRLAQAIDRKRNADIQLKIAQGQWDALRAPVARRMLKDAKLELELAREELKVARREARKHG